MSSANISWSGRIVAVQPRIRLTRSYDERYHSYHGYILDIDGVCGGVAGRFLIAVGKTAHEKHSFHVGMELSGRSVQIEDPRLEVAGFYKTSGITITNDPPPSDAGEPPFHGLLPDLPTIRERGHRRLDPRTYVGKCSTCMWGCRMPVTIIIDHWNPSRRKYRFETFCYGPKRCPFYRAGATRKVVGRNGDSWEEENWIDDEAIAHRPPES
jgi:hypothetical protein